VFVLMLCNDRDVLGPWRNAPWLNALASVIIGTLILLSVILMLSTVFPGIDVTAVALGGGAALAVILVALGAASLRARRGAEAVTVIQTAPEVPREHWTMPPLSLLSRPELSTGRRLLLRAMSAYAVISVILLIVKAVRLAGG
jgi:hypothetical protein